MKLINQKRHTIGDGVYGTRLPVATLVAAWRDGGGGRGERWRGGRLMLHSAWCKSVLRRRWLCVGCVSDVLCCDCDLLLFIGFKLVCVSYLLYSDFYTDSFQFVIHQFHLLGIGYCYFSFKYTFTKKMQIIQT